MSDLVARIERELTRPKRTRGQKIARGVLLTFLLIAVPLLAAETALRIARFHRPQIPMSVQSATNEAAAAALNSRFDTDAFIPDRFLLWKQKPESNVGGVTVNRFGLLGSEPGRTRNDSIRVLCLGDSVTAVTYRTYPFIAQRLIDAASTRTIEFINGGIAGYTTEQALRLIPQLDELQPNFIVFSFGWNDHFPALNLPDKELGARSGIYAWLHRAFYRTRVFQFFSAPSDGRDLRSRQTSETLRVPPGEFAENLSRLIEAGRAMGAQPILATQPAAITAAGEKFFRTRRFHTNGQAVSELHQNYNRIIRDTAAAMHCRLLDLDEEFRRRNTTTLFEPDGMHLAPPGHNLTAKLLITMLRNEELITHEEFDRIVGTARYDTTAPDKPRAAWIVIPERVQTSASLSTAVGVRVKNTGNSTWLSDHVIENFGTRRNVRYGSTSITGNWMTTGTGTAGPSRLKLAHDLLPGESTSTTLEVKAPENIGEYVMEVGLTAEEIGELKHYGAETTTLTVTVIGK